MSAAQFVFIEHDPGRALLAGESLLFHQRKEQVLFLAMMTPVCEYAKEVNCTSGRLEIERDARLAAVGHAVQTIEHLFNDAMFFHQGIDWTHRKLLVLQLNESLDPMRKHRRLAIECHDIYPFT